MEYQDYLALGHAVVWTFLGLWIVRLLSNKQKDRVNLDLWRLQSDHNKCQREINAAVHKMLRELSIESEKQ